MASYTRPLEHAAGQGSKAVFAGGTVIARDQRSLAQGVFTLSLDFELVWGTLDRGGLDRFRRAYEIERAVVVDRLLGLLEEFEISATWCVIGHLFLSSCEEVSGVKHPQIARPSHSWSKGDWFSQDPCRSEESDPLFYAASLIDRIRQCPVPQEIGCHSFSHVIFGDPGCSRQTAASELAECVRLARDRGVDLHSFAFPRNRLGHLDVVQEYGFSCYRGPEPVWYERPKVPGPMRRAAHLVDVLSARHPPVVMPAQSRSGLWNIPGSMLYFPMHGRRRYIPVSVRVRRASKGLERAAAEKRVFHLWFHPTNLADETERMFKGLRTVFEKVAELRDDQRIAVASMGTLISGPPSST